MKLENQIIDKVAERFNGEISNSVVGKRVRLWQHKELRKINRFYQLRPDIDIIFKTESEKIAGAEVKVFHQKENKYIFSGIDQTLSLLRFGLTEVRLIHVFIVNSDNVKDEKTHLKYVQYAASVSDLIRTFRLPISYTPFMAFLKDNKLSDVMYLLGNKEHKDKDFVVNSNSTQNSWGNIEKHRDHRAKIRQYLEKEYLKN